jgi:hypothetical protein
MALPAWPIASFMPDPESFQPIQRMLDPISTDMEGGNTRQRPRPGDNVGTITQTIWMSLAEHDVFIDWVKTTLSNGTGVSRRTSGSARPMSIRSASSSSPAPS